MVKDIVQILRGASKIVISTHVRPDGDAIGSQLALGLFLQAKGKKVAMINADPVPEALLWLDGTASIELFEGHVSQHQRIAAADTIILVDLNAQHRLGRTLAQPLRDAPGTKVLIDHHLKPETWFDYRYIQEGTVATGLLIYELIRAWDAEQLQGTIALALYVAILTDSGLFRYSTVTPEVHRIVADLIDRGRIAPEKVYAAMYETRSTAWPQLLSRVLRTFTLRYAGQLAYLVVAQRTMRATSPAEGDTEGFADFALSVEGVKIALVFTETSRGTKVNFRSKGELAVDRWARSFGGGGHRNAAGAFVRDHLETVISRVVSSASRHTDLTEDDGDPMSYERFNLATMPK